MLSFFMRHHEDWSDYADAQADLISRKQPYVILNPLSPIFSLTFFFLFFFLFLFSVFFLVLYITFLISAQKTYIVGTR